MDAQFAVQQPDFKAPLTEGWVVVGTVSSDSYFGVVHTLYHPEHGILRNIVECT